ncbi:MAG TPA: hypothetical protein VEB22_07620 [Phycisphaerales bacterium]|nr:hypothetical protein [Phycisphaerales bacterium]
MQPPPRRPIPCVHCRYDVRPITNDRKCPECGNPISDTREGTFFYSLPPSQLAAVTLGTGLLGLAIAAWVLTAVIGAVAGTIGTGTASLAASVVGAFIEHFAFAWVPILILAVPLVQHRRWFTPLRVTVLAAMLIGALEPVAVEVFERGPALTPAGLSTSYVGIAVRASFDVAILIALIRARRHTLLLPGRPFQSLAAAAVACWCLFIVVHALQFVYIWWEYRAPYVASAVLTPLLMIPGATLCLLEYRELRAINGDVDAVHPYARA